ncbi:PRC-barrel domain-containing protein [Pseudaminobacter soli (ex Li et al. 2025)]|uniref:Photosystem reaction center subunit H n=1 Tax=Pseudaminobacter soli (ex Li et al. 2025) TaxID=1295366 RepID=A0A2P7S1D0_9HYPH|nr:PRC-barrel domain-containing protein [Mesorhizobium soli]PSJ56284.1 photosystem reaction center subunit H [Mesorhizobium soli]
MRKAILALTFSAALAALAQAHAAGTSSDTFVAVPQSGELSYDLIGLKVTNDNNEKIGEIKDLVLNNNTLVGYILSVAGFLGMDEHYVVVSPSAVKVSYLDSDKKWTATMNATKDELKSAPEFKYEGRWKR